MKQGLSLNQMAAEISRRAENKRDFIADTRQIELQADAAGLVLPTGEQVEAFAASDNTHRQIADRLNIPAKYYDRMRADAPGLLSTNCNHWFASTPERRMIRTLDGNARAFLSDRYRRIDNEDVAETALPILMDVPEMKVESCNVTERRMYIKAVFPRVQAEVRKGDVVQAGIVISNSEIGHGSVSVQPMIYRLVCLNGMIAADSGARRYHIGRNATDAGGRDVFELYADETLEADDRAFMLKLRDVVRATLAEAKFKQIVERMQAAAESDPIQRPVEASEALANRFQLSAREKGSVLSHLVAGGDLSAYGALNAITRAAQDVEDYDRSTELEAVGGRVLTLTRPEWRELAEAA